MENFTPVSALIGGMLIGLAATVLLLFNGRILGVSGIISRTFLQPVAQSAWNLMFLAGLVVGTCVYQVIWPGRFSVSIEAPAPVLVLAGLLVGFGTNLGSGCTSGHGICGLARLSKRSIAATLTFMAFGMLTVYLVKHVLGG